MLRITVLLRGPWPRFTTSPRQFTFKMCEIVLPRCCYCGFAQERFPVVCNFFMLQVRHAIRYNQPKWMPNPQQCHYAKRSQAPVLFGCEDNHSCTSWFASILVGFGNAENEQIRRLRDAAALEHFTTYKNNFAEKYFVKMVLPPRQKPQPFLLAAARDVEETMESDSDNDGGVEMPRGRRMLAWSERNSRTRTAARTKTTLRYARNHPSGTTLASGNPSRITLASRNSSGSLSAGDNVPPPELLVDVLPENEYQGRPRRMVEFRGLDSTTTLTRGNPLITCYGRAAPRSAPSFVTRIDICSQPQGKAAKLLEGVVEKDGATKSRSGFVRAVGMIRNFFSASL